MYIEQTSTLQRILSIFLEISTAIILIIKRSVIVITAEISNCTEKQDVIDTKMTIKEDILLQSCAKYHEV